jgi:uncharacterized protein YqjF (DUF2071 family)
LDGQAAKAPSLLSGQALTYRLTMIDRIAPTRRPNRREAGYQKWRSLLFLHWAVPIDVLRPLVPAQLELDLHDGVAYVGVVPFEMKDIRPRWSPRALAFNFLETNVRTYVLSNDRPGVYFFSLDASSRIAVLAARTGWGLPYYHARMEMTRMGEEINYSTRRPSSGVQHQVRYRIGENLGSSLPGTLEHFLLERYLLFVERRGQILSGQVHHTPYPAHQAHVLVVEDGLIAAAGLPGVKHPPDFAHYSPGVDVEVFGLQVE